MTNKALIAEEYIKFEPFLGRIIVEVVDTDTQEYLRALHGIKEDSSIKDLVINAGYVNQEGTFIAHTKRAIVPLTQGRIIHVGQNSFGNRFEKYYGLDAALEGKSLVPGDIVKFIENQTYKLDPEGKYHVIADDHIIGYIKASEVAIHE